MVDVTTRDVDTRGAVLAAAAVAAFVILQSVVSLGINIGYAFDSSSVDGTGSDIRYLAQGALVRVFTVALPAFVGVLVTFRLLRPITSALTLRRVLLRSLVAIGVVAVALLIAQVVAVAMTTVTQTLFGQRFPLDQFGEVFATVFRTIGTPLSIAVRLAPIVALAGVVLWLWTRVETRER